MGLKTIPTSQNSLTQLLNWVSASPLTGPVDTRAELAPVIFNYISSYGMCHEINTLRLRWPQADPGQGFHPWEGHSQRIESNPTSTRQGKAALLRRGSRTHCINFWANNRQTQELCIGYRKSIFFCGIFLTQSFVPWSRRGALLVPIPSMGQLWFPPYSPLTKNSQEENSDFYKHKVYHICPRIK